MIHSSEKLIIASLFIGLLMLFPSFIGLPSAYDPFIDACLKSSTLHQIQLSACVITIPIAFDAFLDSIWLRIERRIVISRIVILFALSFTCLLQYLTKDFDNAEVYYVSALNCRALILICTYLSLIIQHEVSPAVKKITYGIACLTFIFCIERVIYLMLPRFFVMKVINVIVSLSFLLFMVCSGVSVMLWASFRKDELIVSEKYMVFCAAYLVIVICTKIIVQAIISYSSDSSQHVTVAACYLFLDVGSTILASTMSNRIQKYDGFIAQHQLSTKRNFVRYVSHEIRTPLNTVFLGLQMLRRKFPATSESTLKNVSYNSSDLEDLPIIVSEIEHSCCSAIEILNELLMYDRIEDGKLTLDRECTNAYKTLQTILRSFDIQALSSGIKYIYGGSLNPPQLQDTILIVDINKFNQVIRNLISNALKFSPVGGTVEVTSFFVESEEMVADEFMTAEMRKYPGSSLQTLRIEVSDEGPGISMENQKKLFKDIIQFDAAKLQGGKGTGLGLWISHAIVERHNGKLDVYSEGIPGRGSVFMLELPVLTLPSNIHRKHSQDCNFSDPNQSHVITVQDASEIAVLGSIEEKPLMTSDNIRPPKRFGRALAVDDSQFNRKMMGHALREYFEEVSYACDGDEAVAIVDGVMHSNLNLDVRPIDIIFMDSVMPKICGVDACQMIRNLGYSNMIVGVTGNVLPADIAAFMRAGANKVLGKPLNLNDLDDVLNDLEQSLTHHIAANETRSVPQISSASIPSDYYVQSSPNDFQDGKRLPKRFGRALAVDDSQFNRKMMGHALREYFEEVSYACDGDEAVAIVDGVMHSNLNLDVRPIDIIFMDSVMPKICGVDACQMIRNLGYSNMIVGVTGNVLPADIAAFMRAGANKVLGKPLNLNDLDDVLNGTVAHYCKSLLYIDVL